MRGRNNNNNGGNRKGPNPLTRSYESNGPDVKIRGNAHHVAEKYLQLARDAQSSGDPVAAESYLQHAEHYFRLIASAQQAQSGLNRQPDAVDTEGDDDDDSGIPDRFASPPVAAPYVPQAQPQPYAGDRQPYAGGGERPAYADRQPSQPGERQPYAERPAYNGERPQQDRQDRVPYGQRNGQDRNMQDRNGQDRNGMGRRPYRDGTDRGQDGRNGDDRGTERFDRNRNRQDRGFDNRNGQDREVRAFGSAPIEQPRDAYAGDQPRAEAPERQPDVVTVPSVIAPVVQRLEPAQRAEPSPRGEPGPRAATAEEAPGLPSFITMPTRTAPIDPVPAPDLATASAFPGDDAAGEVTKFPRRRRRPTRTAAAETADGPGEPSGSGD